MFNIPQPVLTRYTSILKNNNIEAALSADYKKWLRYYWDYSGKYPVPDDKTECIRLFCEKLRLKKQTDEQRQQATHAVSLYFEIEKQEEDEEIRGVIGEPVEQWLSNEKSDTTTSRAPHHPGNLRVSQYHEAGYEEKSCSPEWDAVLNVLAAEIKVRHYSHKTLKTYANWSRRFQKFLKHKSPMELSTVDVKEYLTYLAVKCNVAASTQNQAFNSILFLYRHALKREFGELRDVPRAKKSLYIPMVLSRPEIDAILNQLSHPFNLVVSMLFGCGLRLFEGLQLRVRDFNFDDGVLT